MANQHIVNAVHMAQAMAALHMTEATMRGAMVGEMLTAAELQRQHVNHTLDLALKETTLALQQEHPVPMKGLRPVCHHDSL